MTDKNKIYYWCPFINNVATIKAVYNSAMSLKINSKNKFEGIILDVFGEWEKSKFFNQANIKFFKLNNSKIIKSMFSQGFIFSRLKYLLIFFISYFPLKNFFETYKPKFLIIHLMTSLPLLLNLIYKYDTKIILRISGKPKLNFVRYYFWKIALKKVFMVTFPTIETMNYFKTLKLVDERKISLLYDPIISTREITKKLRKEPIEEKELRDKNFFLAIGRLTVQKNFKFLIESFNELIKKNKLINLVIIGDGEQFNFLKNMINEYGVEKNIRLVGYKDNVFKYLHKCEAFILSSLWEDPGFVIVEAMYSNTFVLASDCKSGPSEIIGENRGLLFKNNSKEDFINKFQTYCKLSSGEKFKIKCEAKKFTKKFSLLNHYINLENILLKKND